MAIAAIGARRLVNRQQEEVIEYLVTENRVLRKKLGKKRVLLTDRQRRQLAVKGKILGRKMLEEFASVATPETILRWHRELVAGNWDFSNRRKKMGRPPVPKETADLVLKLAKENPRWGYNRIQGAIRNLGYSISDTAIAKILQAHGIDPAPDRKRQSSWKSFLHTHWDVLASVDFTTIGVWTKKGLVTYYLLFFMEIATRRVHFAGLTTNPDEDWLLQVARNLTDADDGFLRGKRYLLMDRDTKFSEAFRGTFDDVEVKPLRLPAKSPNLTPHIERYMRSLKEECLERMIFFGERSLQAATVSYVDHFLSVEYADRLSSIRVPTLITVGDHDECAPSLSEEMNKAIAGSKLVILPKSGHMTFVDQPHMFNRSVSEFLHPTTEKK